MNVEAGEGLGWLTVVSSLLGVLLGAALAYFTTYQFEKRRRREEILARSFSLFFAIHQMADDLYKMNLDLQTSLDRARKAGVEGELWTRLRFSVGYAETEIVIPAGDLAVVAMTRDSNLVLEISEVEAAHRIYTQSIRKLDELITKFESFELHTDVQGETVGFEADRLQLPRVAPTVIQLRTLSNSLAAGIPKASKQARAIAEKLGPHLKKHYKFKHFLTLTFPSEEA